MKGIVIAGTGSGVGKTSIATGLMRKLSRRMKVQGFKVGPDFIDPMYHRAATGRYSRNLDSFMMSKDVVKNVAAYGSKDADISIIEGVRGLFEGQSGKDDSGSTAEIAKLLGLPVVLVVNARSLTRSAAAIVNGFRSYDKEIDIAGVILNNVSGAQHEGKLKDAMEDSGTRVLGIVRRDVNLRVQERHLGLSAERSSDKDVLDGMEGIADGVDIDQLLDICCGSQEDEISCPYVRRDSGLTAAVPMDDAFCFYYRENIECMTASGVKIEYFSPLNGDPLPDADMYYLGGGYPELYMEWLSENRDFFQGLRTACDDGKVIIGECGGMLPLCTSVKADGIIYETAGIFDAEADMIGKRHGPSYVIARANKKCGLFDGTVRGHEFHYSTVSPRPECEFGFDILRGSGLTDGKDGMVRRNALGTYMHQHALSSKDWMGKITDICR
ncbi:MAG: hydrogenobyrinic acid a,c-diamide synthase (glutamine-hydrolyzing) [Methanomassiliicoccaceae archaeon]|nr:hydrogenobyrinic acid a,c-diamide synthase (glutamine-hydrolyzing) [Methanomassiliicoccaceae archaeon]